MFHGVSSKKRIKITEESQPHLDKKDLEKILRWLENHFEFLTPNELINTNKSGVLLTFDDGYANNYHNVLPLLEKFNCPAIYFVSTQHIIDPRDWLSFTKKMTRDNWKDYKKIPEEVKSDLYDGMSEKLLKDISVHPLITVGNHSKSHPLLSACSYDEIIKEVKDSKDYLEQLISERIEYFAYPTGDYNRQVLKIIKNIGYQAAFGIDDTNNIGSPKFEIPRIGIYSSRASYLSAKMSGLYRKPLKKPFVIDRY
mgnify:CR=1 FL=1|tara:strand:+ start:1205 stop:1966 length:762 start_codon:yes stop_codon:yes gene_type:complete